MVSWYSKRECEHFCISLFVVFVGGEGVSNSVIGGGEGCAGESERVRYRIMGRNKCVYRYSIRISTMPCHAMTDVCSVN